MNNSFSLIFGQQSVDFSIQDMADGRIIFRESGRESIFTVLSRNQNLWVLQDEQNRIFRIFLDKSGQKFFAQTGFDSFTFELLDAESLFRSESQKSGQSRSQSSVVVAPMPGRIVKIVVSEGDVVEPAQTLLVIEAMKMENEYRAQSAGRVKKIHVRAGDVVESKAVLLEIEPMLSDGL